ncbi:MAG TPA: prepilin peptidase [Candidatus Saccharibacteria bacterium]|nr:prepilin peptidase [Candidatus Saccharibacteria bacterium]
MFIYEVFICVFLAVLGAAMGSFAGAVVWRLKHKRDIVRERSECEHCHHKLGVLDLIPIVSWVTLAGKCRYCHKPIGRSALLLEVALAAYFVISYLAWPYGLTTGLEWLALVLWLVMGVGLAILFVYDLRWYLLPDKVVFPLIAVSGVLFVLRAVAQGWTPGIFIVELALALLAVAGFYGFIYTVSKGEWVGFGDVKLGVVIGLALGWQLALLAVLIANLVGVLVILPGLASGKLQRSSRVPFGPFLITGLVLSGLFGHQILLWYASLITPGF